MIYITGDTHSDFRRFSRRVFPEQADMTKEDYVIIAGDFGGIWYSLEDSIHQRMERYNLDELDDRSFTTLFIPGNHENYDRLMSDEFPVEEWNGVMVKKIRPSILMLMRGEMYNIDGAKIFAFGGASSHDVSDGILDSSDPDWRKKAKDLERRGKYYFRVKGLSWWPAELPTEEEMLHGLDVLDTNNWKTDFVITHCAPSSTQALLGFHGNDCLTRYLDEVHARLDYRKWFFGHYHDNRNMNAQDILLYEQIIRIR